MWTYTISSDGWLVPGIGFCSIMDNVPPELAAILKEIEKALEHKLYYLAIAVSLSIPDICARLELDEDEDPKQVGVLYCKWADANIAWRFQTIEGRDLYRFRCGVLHAGNLEHKKSSFDRVIFIGPESRIKMHDMVLTVDPDTTISGIKATDLRVAGKVLHMDVFLFCKAIMDAASEWVVASSKVNPNVRRNLPRLIRYRPDGLQPFSVGVPTVA
jgi:hypothetical protein